MKVISKNKQSKKQNKTKQNKKQQQQQKKPSTRKYSLDRLNEWTRPIAHKIKQTHFSHHQKKKKKVIKSLTQVITLYAMGTRWQVQIHLKTCIHSHLITHTHTHTRNIHPSTQNIQIKPSSSSNQYVKEQEINSLLLIFAICFQFIWNIKRFSECKREKKGMNKSRYKGLEFFINENHKSY